jgi:uncharacterized membrane protein
MEAITSFKFGKKGIIIIVLSVVILFLFIALLYIIGKRRQEIQFSNSLAEKENELAQNEHEKKENQLHIVFDNYRTGKYKNAKEAIALTGLSTGTFYRELKNYESARK